MRSSMRMLAAVVLLSATVLASQPAAAQSTTVNLSGAAAKQQVDALAGQIGSRPAGSPNYERATEYAAEQLRQWGYQPSVQPFPVPTYDDRGSLLEANGISIETDTLVYSVPGEIQGPLVAVGGVGSADDLAAVDVRGKVALIKRGTLRFSEKVANAAAAGSSGVVIYNEGDGRVQGSLVRQEPIPAVTISAADGQRLLEMLASGAVNARLLVDASVENRGSSNVIAELPGSRPDAGTIVIGGHLDSVRASPGANDNASGSAVVLELARLLAQSDPGGRPLTLRFVLFGAEELGLFGSRHYVEALSEAERQAIVAMINLDMVGVGDSWRLGGTDDLVQRALGATNDLGERALPLRGQLSSSSDHASFMNAGVPALFIHRVDDPNYHTPGDLPELVDPNALGSAGTITLRVVESLAAER